MTRLRSADGQVTVMAAVLMVFLVAMVAFVLDVGSWFRQQRISQSTVDAAALAGAQVLPNDPGGATTMASTFANKNGGVLGATITIGSKWNTNDMITVKQTKSATGFFSKVLGINTVSVHAKASAVAAMCSGTFYDSPRGLVRLDGNLLDQDVYLAAAHGLEFEIQEQIASVT